MYIEIWDSWSRKQDQFTNKLLLYWILNVNNPNKYFKDKYS